MTESRQRIGRVRGSSALTGTATAQDEDDYDEDVCGTLFSLTIDPSNTYYRRYAFTLLLLGCLSCYLLVSDVRAIHPHHPLLTPLTLPLSICFP